MKRLIVLALILFATQAHGATLCWDYGPDMIDGFKVYSINSADYGVIEPTVTIIADPLARQWPLPTGAYLEGQTYLFWMTAYQGALESVKSETLQWTAPVVIPDEIPTPYNLEMVE